MNSNVIVLLSLLVTIMGWGVTAYYHRRLLVQRFEEDARRINWERKKEKLAVVERVLDFASRQIMGYAFVLYQKEQGIELDDERVREIMEDEFLGSQENLIPEIPLSKFAQVEFGGEELTVAMSNLIGAMQNLVGLNVADAELEILSRAINLARGAHFSAMKTLEKAMKY